MNNKEIMEELKELSRAIHLMEKKVSDTKSAAYGIIFILVLIAWLK